MTEESVTPVGTVQIISRGETRTISKKDDLALFAMWVEDLPESHMPTGDWFPSLSDEDQDVCPCCGRSMSDDL